ncbi:Oidioi.mRNA.OKI2018_I69.PAR.g9195.t1.cds [Oikopleura dioica]|uniref:Oidioi.mRNA.OKI2018_I69.PAR.g9195.t1.cds n=1 Tax=Oikopleura dioica TaxID=34765 RepID=A0ABN7RNM0_OIKDI|nr:Oidioi.mRNA.OKI2018_I69.PAR.g9195.t1.cds [Oikopleura dioica]
MRRSPEDPFAALQKYADISKEGEAHKNEGPLLHLTHEIDINDLLNYSLKNAYSQIPLFGPPHKQISELKKTKTNPDVDFRNTENVLLQWFKDAAKKEAKQIETNSKEEMQLFEDMRQYLSELQSEISPLVNQIRIYD